MKTTAERKAAERARKRQSGLRPCELWLSITELKAVRALLKRLRRRQSRSPLAPQCTCKPPQYTEYSATIYLPDPKCPTHGGIRHLMFVGERRSDNVPEAR